MHNTVDPPQIDRVQAIWKQSLLIDWCYLRFSNINEEIHFSKCRRF